MKKYIFLDTNAFLHFAPPSEIDWLSLALCSQAVLVISPIVLRELNKHKDTSTLRKIKQRAASALKLLGEYSDSTPPINVRRGVELEFRVNDPLIEFADFQLSREVPDDWLLATAVEFAIETGLPQYQVLVCSNDLGLTLKARSQPLIASLPIPSHLRLPDELNAEERRSRELEEENRQLRNALPDLTLSFPDGNPYSNATRRELIAIDEDKLKAIVDEARSKYPVVEIGHSTGLPGIMAIALGDQYRQEY
ncbi:MAG: PIN domain-containing protein, partial [Candidatus Korobacteraceae bacterium]